MSASLRSRIARTPRIHDAERAAETDRTFSDLAPEACSLLSASASVSPHLATLMGREADWLRECLEDSPENRMATILQEADADGINALGDALRIAKRRAALLIALADLSAAWELASVTGALTDLADRAVSLGLSTLVRAEIERGKLPGCNPDHAAEAAGMFALAMGKMGAHELNYSSDIDLIILFDESRHDPKDFSEIRRGFIRVTQRLVKLLQEQTGEGYVFRTDLRLRPDPSVTPVCIATEPAERYYESLGRTWERAAFIKARPCAGAISAGKAFLERLRPFVWRRHLDYAAIQDAHDMRLRIRKHKGLTGPLEVLDHDLKLGQGGIREIEFFTQTRQLIVGGRDPDLRQRGTVDALQALTAKGWVEADVAAELEAAYVEHRMLEHRIQMLDDAQTHRLPATEADFARVAALAGEEPEALASSLRARLERVSELTEPFFAPEAHASKDAPDIEDVFTDPETARARISSWTRLPAFRTERARRIFGRIEPKLLTRLKAAADPDGALQSLDAFLAGLPAGVQLFSLFEAHPALLDLLVDICATTPELARYLSRNSGVLDAVISSDFYRPFPPMSELLVDLAGRLADVDDYETALNFSRIWMKERHFRIGTHLLRQIASPEEAASAYSAVAEAALRALYPVVVEEFARRHGPPPGAGAVVLGMGKLGSREMTATSDLDLIVIYDAEGAESSEGKKSLSVQTYYARLTQALIAALTAPMAEGALYKVDMRLRPSGRAGPVAVSLPAFRRYQAEEAWTWEHLALTRARVVAGPATLGETVAEALGEVIRRPHDEKKVFSDAADMRRRLAEAHETAAKHPWEVKLGPGRIMDIELLAQTGALVSNLADARRPSRMLDRLGRAGWIDSGEAGRLGGTLNRLTAIQQIMRLASDHTMSPAEGGAGLEALVLAATDASDLAALEQSLAEEAAACEAIIAARIAAGTGTD